MHACRRPANYCDTCKRGFRDPYSLLRHMMQSKLHKANQHDAFSALLDVVSDDTPAGHADAAKPKAKLAPQDDVPSMPSRLLLVLLRLSRLLLLRLKCWMNKACSDTAMHGDPGIMPVLCWIPVDPGCFLGAGIVIPAHSGVWDRDPGWVPGQRHLCLSCI